MSSIINKTYQRSNVIIINTVLINTYALLGMSLLISAFCAILSASMHLPAPGILLTMLGYYGLFYAVQKNATNASAIIFVFLLTGFMGYTLGPLLNMLLSSNAGTNILISSLLGTGISFISLSAYALVTKTDFNFMNGFLFTSLIGCVVASCISLIFNIPMLSLLVSCAMTVISAGMILSQTSEIIHGGERNYILATVSLFVTLYNLFLNLIHILSAFSSNNRD